MICRHRIGFFLYLTGLLLSSFPSHVISDDTDSETASTPNLDVRIVSEGGFGCKSNLYSWSMETYKGKVYVGTNNNRGGAFGLRFFIAALPLRIFTAGGQIHRGTLDPDTGDWTWEEVVRDGLTRKNNYGVRKMKAVGDWLYAVTGK